MDLAISAPPVRGSSFVSLARGYDVRELPIEYAERAGETKLDPLTGGAEIAKSILKVGLEERF